MSRELSMAVLRAGLISPSAVAEIKRWGLPLDVEEVEEPATSAEEAIALIREALDAQSMVEIRDTDLDIMKAYLEHQERGRLVIKKEAIPVSFCKLRTGEYAIPWLSESISDLLLDGESHLKIGRKKVYLYDIREVFFGEMKAFMVCMPGRRITEDE